MNSHLNVEQRIAETLDRVIDYAHAFTAAAATDPGPAAQAGLEAARDAMIDSVRALAWRDPLAGPEAATDAQAA